MRQIVAPLKLLFYYKKPFQSIDLYKLFLLPCEKIEHQIDRDEIFFHGLPSYSSAILIKTGA
jgi:hypothetical protein